MTHSHFGCQDVIIDEAAYVAPKQCWRAINDRTLIMEEFNITNLVLGVQKATSFFSHGHRDSKGNCRVATFIRRGKVYENSYEKSIAEFTVRLIPAHTTDGITEGNAGEDILLPEGLRLPANKLFYGYPSLGTIVWNYNAPACRPGVVKPVTELYRGPMQMRRHRTAAPDKSLMGALLTVIPDAEDTTHLSKAFGLVLKYPTTICGTQAYQSNLEDTYVVFLRDGDEGIDANPMAVPSDPSVLSLATQSSLLHITTNLRLEDMYQQFHKQICANERRGLLNMLQNVRSSDSGDVVAPLFGRGHMVMKAGSVAHIIECVPVDVQLNLAYDKCSAEIPVLKPISDNETVPYFVHPISRILTPTETELPCSSKFPQVFRLDDGQYVCNAGKGMTRCMRPTIIQPATNDLPVEEWVDFTRAMSIGIMSQPEIQALSMKLHHHSYLQHMAARQLWMAYDEGNIGPGSDVNFILPVDQLDRIVNVIENKFFPVFRFMGDAFAIVFGILVFAAMVAYFLGTVIRIWREWHTYGCTPYMPLVFCSSIWEMWRLPLAMVKGAVNASKNQGSFGHTDLNEALALISEELQRQKDKGHLRKRNINLPDDSSRYNDNPELSNLIDQQSIRRAAPLPESKPVQEYD